MEGRSGSAINLLSGSSVETKARSMSSPEPGEAAPRKRPPGARMLHKMKKQSLDNAMLPGQINEVRALSDGVVVRARLTVWVGGKGGGGTRGSRD